uniref:Uncharacterized protein n=1 Tax=Caenorhabditis tropicalis TaxID=1561998 RepID=A0A1I7TET5_9PELO
MASFNQQYLDNLMEKLQKGEEMIENLERLKKLNIPLALAEKLNIEKILSRWIPYGEMGKLSSEVVQKIQKTKNKEEKKRKRKSEGTVDQKAKKIKVTPEENSGEQTAVSVQKETKKATKKRVLAPLFKKSMKDRRNCRF